VTGSPTADIAREVDRLVIGVHRAVMSLHRSQLREMVETLGVKSPGYFYDLAEFWAVGPCTIEIARRRFRYQPTNAAETLIGGLHDRRLIDDELRPSRPLIEASSRILLWRAQAAAKLWGTDLATAQRGAAEALPHGSGPMVEAFRLLPVPAPAAHRLHHLLTGLRYARMDAHIASWEAVGLSAAEIAALSSAVASEPVSPAPASLVAKGWLTTHGSATAEGHAARSSIEAATNSHCDPMFDTVTDGQEWLAALRSLPHRGQ
jgi:hypothetical protein